MYFTGKHRIIRHAIDLGFLDLAIPIRTFHQTNHQAFLAAFSQINDVIHDIEAAFLVGLNHKTNAFPVIEFRFKTKTF